MSNQPYIYTMPQGFMEDESVPVKWRLYGYINGFWISGRVVFASNHYLSEQVKCSERQIQRAIKDLEDDGYLHRFGISQHRQLLPVKVEGTTPGVARGRHPASQGDDMGRPHSSDSISESRSTSFFDRPSEGTRVEDGSDDTERKPKRPSAPQLAPSFVVSKWNSYPNWKALKKAGSPPNPSVIATILPKATQTQDITAAIVKKRSKYSEAEFCSAIENYVLELLNRKKDSGGFYTHRFTLYEFLTHKNIFEKYVNR